MTVRSVATKRSSSKNTKAVRLVPAPPAAPSNGMTLAEAERIVEEARTAERKAELDRLDARDEAVAEAERVLLVLSDSEERACARNRWDPTLGDLVVHAVGGHANAARLSTEAHRTIAAELAILRAALQQHEGADKAGFGAWVGFCAGDVGRFLEAVEGRARAAAVLSSKMAVANRPKE